MSDQEAEAIFGFDDSSLGADQHSYVDNGSSSAQGHDPAGPDNSNNSTSPGGQFLYDSSNWSYADTPGYDFNFNAPGSAAPSASVFQASAPWQLPSDQQQQQQQQPPPQRQQQPQPQQQQQGSPTVGTGYNQPSQRPQGYYSNPAASNATDPASQSFEPQRLQAPGGQALVLTPAQQEKLRSIAMPAHLQYQSPRSESSPGSATSDAKALLAGFMPSPDNADPSSANNRKRKSSADAEEEEEDEDGQPIKKTAHNMIEKRYRTNLNDKIAALRDSVPSLRIMSKSARGEDTTEDREELHGLTPAHKLNKATVLSKATEYIRHLEKRNNRLLDENGAMQARIAAFEKLFMAGAMTGAMSPMQQPPTPMQYPQDQYISPSGSNPRDTPAQGMIQVPDDMKRILAAQMGNQPYPVPPAQQSTYRGNPAMIRQQQIQQQQQQQQQMQQGGRWANTGPYFGKLMVGSLAGLMIVEAVRTEEQDTEKPDGRGLFGLPTQFLSYLGSESHVHFAGQAVPVAHIISHLKILLLFGLLLFVFLPSLFASPKKPEKEGQQVGGSIEAAPSLASPIHVRRQAWLTAIQTVWVPKHNFFLEAAALLLKTMKLSLRNTIGMHGYQMLTGLSEEEETARVKAWSIALDAQLAGGDVEINKSRLTLTLLASGTLPDTPLRLMLKALHIRVLLWDLGSKGLHNTVAAALAKSRWNEAKQLHRMLMQQRKSPGQPHDDDLPEHLAALLDHDCDEVLNDSVIRRAYNLAWNLPTTENVNERVNGMDAVVEDQAVRSPMDAIAAWRSSQEVQGALTAVATVADDENKESQQARAVEHISNALKMAPIASDAQGRALVVRAVLLNKSRGANIAQALEAVRPSSCKGQQKAGGEAMSTPTLFDLTASTAIQSLDVQIALQCAMAIAHLQRSPGKSSSCAASPSPTRLPYEGLRMIGKMARPAVTASMSLLGYTALFKLMNELHAHPEAAETFSTSLETLAGSLRIWIGGAAGEKSGLGQDARHRMVDRCLGVTKSLVGMETDTGYGSMSECEDENGC